MAPKGRFLNILNCRRESRELCARFAGGVFKRPVPFPEAWFNGLKPPKI